MTSYNRNSSRRTICLTVLRAYINRLKADTTVREGSRSIFRSAPSHVTCNRLIQKTVVGLFMELFERILISCFEGCFSHAICQSHVVFAVIIVITKCIRLQFVQALHVPILKVWFFFSFY